MRTLILSIFLIGPACFTALAADANAGKTVYDVHCKGCHGANGAAPANVTKLQNGRMPDLRSTAVQSMSAADLSKIVSGGKGKMRGDTSVTGMDLDNLVAFVLTLKS